jgi:DNA mismatch endonuclease (patch repair protein)
MTDVHSEKIRSFNMSRIKGRDTKPEILVRQFLHSNGFRYRLHNKELPGKPDIVLKKYNTVIMIHGCFWHGHENCKYFVIPKTRTDWWVDKINKNKERDKENESKLMAQNWNVITIFECELKQDSKISTFNRLLDQMKSGNTYN